MFAEGVGATISSIEASARGERGATIDAGGRTPDRGDAAHGTGSDAPSTSEGASTTLEVRWIRRGELRDDVVEWLGPFGDEIEERQDRYLLTASGNLGVKIRGGAQLDLKAFRGSPGTLVPAAGVRGRLESWERWSFPLGSNTLPPVDAPAWLTVEKARRRRSFRVVDARVVERSVSDAELPGCTIELTEVAVDGETWWTLGLEARGGPQTLERIMPMTAEALFRGPPPVGTRLELPDSMSYAAWMGRRVDTLDPGGADAP